MSATRQQSCSMCFGTGRSQRGGPCPFCHGTGQIQRRGAALAVALVAMVSSLVVIGLIAYFFAAVLLS